MPMPERDEAASIGERDRHEMQAHSHPLSSVVGVMGWTALTSPSQMIATLLEAIDVPTGGVWRSGAVPTGHHLDSTSSKTLCKSASICRAAASSTSRPGSTVTVIRPDVIWV